MVAGAVVGWAASDLPPDAGAPAGADTVDDGLAARTGFNTTGVEFVVERLPNSMLSSPLVKMDLSHIAYRRVASGL
jgi:hypothetical protein